MIGKSTFKLITMMIVIILLVFNSPQISKATCCFPYNCNWPGEDENFDECPRSGQACEFTVTTVRCYDTGCNTQMNCMTTIPTCYLCELIADGENTLSPGGDTCYRVIGGNYCSIRNPREITKITIWWSWVSSIGGEAACDLDDCFFCYYEPPEQPSNPECGHQFKNCPYG